MSNLLKDWDDYYKNHFNKTKDDVRNDCHPQIFQHGDQRNAIVLVHGLTDSPYFMREIGEYFAAEMGFDVYIPLLLAHGLKEPEGMKDASADGWKKNVEFAIETAKSNSGGQISIGGFSTGGTLSVNMAFNKPETITGGVFLFSAALGLAGAYGKLAEHLLRTYILEPMLDKMDKRPLVDSSPSGNPYRYSHMDLGGAAELSKLIKEIDELEEHHVIQQPLFAAHSEADTTAMFDEVKKLIDRSPRSNLFRIGQYFNVPHASVVLKKPVFSENESPLESENPFFDLMIKKLHEFAATHTL